MSVSYLYRYQVTTNRHHSYDHPFDNHAALGISMISRVYLDLFDDGLYEGMCLRQASDLNTSILNTLRFQILLALLFKRTIVVPECWLASSATFHVILGEIAPAYTGVVKSWSAASGTLVKKIKPPFVFAFSQSDEMPLIQAYAADIVRRIREDRRLMFSSALMAEDIGLRRRVRDQLVARLETVFSGRDVSSDSVATAFAESIASALDEDEAESVRTRISGLISYLSNPYVTAAPHTYGIEKKWNKHTAFRTKSVEAFAATVAGRAESPLDKTATAFLSLFEWCSKNAVHRSDVMAMQRYARQMPSGGDAIGAIEALGRFSMHSGYGRAVGADTQTFTGQFYSQGSEAGVEFVDAYLRWQGQRLEASHASLSSTGFFELLKHGSYDLTDTIDWQHVWESVFEFAYVSPRWQRLQKEFLRKHSGKPMDESKARDFSLSMFDAINDEIHAFAFQLDKRSSHRFKILKRALRPIGEDDVRAVGSETGKLIASNAGHAPEVGGVWVSSLFALARLAPQMIPRKYYYAGIRAARRLNSLFQ